jgi:hypothetical protein
MGHVLQGNDVRGEGPAQRLPERDGGGRDGSGAVERELPGLLPRVGQVLVRLLWLVVVTCVLAGRVGVNCVLINRVLVRRVLAGSVLFPRVRVRLDAGLYGAAFEAVSNAASDSISTAISDPISTAISDCISTCGGEGSAAVRGRSRHAPEASAAA